MLALKFLALLLVCARAQLYDKDGNEIPRVLCGRVLADARMFICYDDPETQKRNGPSGLIASLDQRQRPVAKGAAWQQWMTAANALAMRGKRNPGLADECCLKACYLSELLSYC